MKHSQMKCCTIRIKHVTFQVPSDETNMQKICQGDHLLFEKTNALPTQNQ